MKLQSPDILIVDLQLSYGRVNGQRTVIGQPEVVTEVLPGFPRFITTYEWYELRRELAERGYQVLPEFTQTESNGTMRLVLVKRSFLKSSDENKPRWKLDPERHAAILKARDGVEAAA